MNKDNVLFAVIGLLLGFLAGYLLQEVMVARQPPRLLPGQALAGAAPGGAPAQGAPGPAAGSPGDAGNQAAMAQIQELRERVERNPNDADAVLQLGHLNFDIRNWARARDLYQQYLTMRPADPNVLTDLAVTQRELGELEGALATLQKAQEMAPDHWQSRFNAVIVLVDLKRFGEADAALAELKRLQPDNEQVEALAAAVARERAAAG